jgi:hypothetical protein
MTAVAVGKTSILRVSLPQEFLVLTDSHAA